MQKIFALAAAALVATSAQAATNLVVNGSFESGITLAPSGLSVLNTDDDSSLTGWKVLSSGIYYVDNSVWDAADGSRSIELATEAGLGGVVQRVNGFTAGYRYRLSFDVSADPFDDETRPKASRYVVSVSGGLAEVNNYTLNNVNTATNMLYDTVSYDFVASSTSQNLQFRGLGQTRFGTVIDAVSISVVPEASTWAMLVAGFGFVGFASRRRSRGSVSA